jgi:hypothetical protein
MPSGSWRGGAADRLCKYAKDLQTLEQEILARINDSTSPEQFTQLQQSLLLLREDLITQAKQDPFHFPNPTAGHRCVAAYYQEVVARLRHRYILRVPPPVPPPPRPKPLSDEDMMTALDDMIASSATETPLGEEREKEEPG